MADNWNVTLDLIGAAGLLDTVLYIDLCNEWPLSMWAPFFSKEMSAVWNTPASLAWMNAAMARVRKRHPGLPLLFSFCAYHEHYLDADMAQFDLFEHHVSMAAANNHEYDKEVGYDYERFDLKSYKHLNLNAERVHRARQAYWNKLLTDQIDSLASVAARVKKPLVTTECWSVVDYKDWPLLKWDWVKDVCAIGTRRAECEDGPAARCDKRGHDFSAAVLVASIILWRL